MDQAQTMIGMRYRHLCDDGPVDKVAPLIRLFRRSCAVLAAVGLIAVSTASAATERVPVVFVPGFMGSKLADDKGEIWGSLSAMINRAADLRYRGGDGGGSVRATGPLTTVQLFGPFQVVGYKSIIRLFERLGFVENRDLFLFAYDWRKSNLDSAKALAGFIEQQPALKGRRFNIVAHSMGGLVSSVYIRRHGGAERIRYFITLGTPHLGSAKLLANMLGSYSGDLTMLRHAMGEENYLGALLSFPSVYEQLPSDAKSCVLRRRKNRAAETCKLLDTAFWSNPKFSRNVRRFLPPRLASYLKNGRTLKEFACAEMPEGVRVFRFAGTRIQTLGRVELDMVSGFSLRRRYVFGDGTVSSYSASCGDVAGTEIVFSDHQGMLENATVRYRLANILLDNLIGDPLAELPNLRTIASGDAALSSGRDIETLPGIAVTIKSSYLAPGGELEAEIVLTQPNGLPLQGAILSAGLAAQFAPENVSKLTVRERQSGAYHITGAIGTTPGIYRLRVDIPGVGAVENYVAALPLAAVPGPIPPGKPGVATAGKDLPLQLSLSSDRGRSPHYRLGERLNLVVSADKDAWIYCFYRQSKGGLYKLFPNDYHRDPYIAPGKTHTIPGDLFPFDLTFVAPPGREEVRCFATDRNVSDRLPAAIRGLAFEPLPAGMEGRLGDIFRALDDVAVAEARLHITVER